MEKQQEILLKIQSSDPTQIAEAIQEIKENGDLAIAKIILDTLPTIQDFHTRTTLINLLADIKENANDSAVFFSYKGRVMSSNC